MRSDSTHQPRKGEFFKLPPDATRRGKGHGVVFENEDALLATLRLILLPEAGGFPPLVKPRAWSIGSGRVSLHRTWKAG